MDDDNPTPGVSEVDASNTSFMRTSCHIITAQCMFGILSGNGSDTASAATLAQDILYAEAITHQNSVLCTSCHFPSTG